MRKWGVRAENDLALPKPKITYFCIQAGAARFETLIAGILLDKGVENDALLLVCNHQGFSLWY
jgi:hypothetical protein